MPIVREVTVHNLSTRRSQYQYQFTPKHHGGVAGAAQWMPDLSLNEEFAVFNSADDHDLSDNDGDLYGLQREGEDSLRILGIWHEQIAEFPSAREGEVWHGYPVYPLVNEGPQNRRGQQGRPDKIVFGKMYRAGLISQIQRRRLMKGDHA